MSDIASTIQKMMRGLTVKEDSKRKLSWDSEAVKVIKQKIEHYKATGNIRKLMIYEAKLYDKQLKIRKLKSLLEKL